MNLMLSQLLSSLLLVSPLHTLPVCRVIKPQSQVSSRSEHQPGQLGFVYFLKDISQTQTRPEITSHFKIRARGGGTAAIQETSIEECDWTAEKSWRQKSLAALDVE